MDVERLKKACENAKAALGVEHDFTGCAEFAFESGTPVDAHVEKSVPLATGQSFAEIKTALAAPPSFYGSLRVRFEGGKAVHCWPKHSVKLR